MNFSISIARRCLLPLLLTLLGLLYSSRTDAQGIIFQGDTVVCTGSTYQYDRYQDTFRYEWAVSRGSIVMHTSQYTKQIMWGAPGKGYIIVSEFNDSSIKTREDTLWVRIVPLPVPVIKAQNIYACEPLDEPDRGTGEFPKPPKQFDDTLCQKVCAYGTTSYTAGGQPGSTYEWSVAGGVIIGSANSSTCQVEWPGPGAGKITLKETTINGCIGQSSFCIDIRESPMAHFVALPDTSQRHLQICLGSKVVFIDRSTYDPQSPIVSWRWDFGDGTFSSGKTRGAPIIHAYDNPGSYTVTLTVTNRCGCSTSETMQVDVDPAAGVEIVCPGVVCDSARYVYQVDAACTSGTWSVNGGTITNTGPNYVEIYWDQVDPEEGHGYIMYDPGGCAGYCPQPVATKIPVVTKTATIKGPQYLCVNQQYLYSLPQWPTTEYNWSVNSAAVTLSRSDQGNEIVLTPNAYVGTVVLTCQYRNTLLGCTGSAMLTIQMPGMPVITDTVFDFCEGVETTFHLAGANAHTATWTLMQPDLTPIVSSSGTAFPVQFSQLGTYFLSVTGAFCPPQTKELHVIGYPNPPESITGPYAICRGIPFEYRAGTVDNDHVFDWQIANATLNTTVGEVTEVKLSTTAGSYPFALRAYRVTKAKPHCRSDWTLKEIEQPVVIFDIWGRDSVCPSEYQNYQTMYNEGEEYAWSIHPHTMGSVEKGQGTKHVSVLWNKQAGIAKLVCRITKCYNAYSYDTMDVYIRPLVLDLTIDHDTICMSGQHSFAHVNVATGGVNWDDGEVKYRGLPGDNSHLLTYGNFPLKEYTKYYITASVDSPYGCATPIYAKDSIVVTPSPYIRMHPKHLMKDCDPWSHTITTSWDTSGVTPATYTWTKNGVTLGTDSFLTVSALGTYKVEVAGSFGCPARHEITVEDRCYSSSGGGGGGGGWYPPGDPCFGRNVTIRAEWEGYCKSAFVPGDSIITVTRTLPTKHSYIDGSWRPSDEGLRLLWSNDSTAEYLILKAGVHRIYYTANYSDGAGGICRYTPDTFLTVPLVIKLEIEGLCTPDSISGDLHFRHLRLTDRSTAIEPILSRTYRQLDSTGLSNNMQILNTDVTSFEIASIVHSRITRTGDRLKRFTLEIETENYKCQTRFDPSFGRLPTADFSFKDSICEKDAAVRFTSSAGNAPSGFRHLWDFTDGAMNDQQDPERVFDVAGPYDVKLKITDLWGCSDSITKRVRIMSDEPGGNVTISPEYPCQNALATATYDYSIGRMPTHYEWFDKNAVFIGSGNYQWDVNKSGYYYAYVRDQHGCTHTSKGDTVQFIKVPKAIVYGDQTQCAGVPFGLSGYVGRLPGLSYSWLRNGAVISGATKADISQTINTAGTYYYQVVTTVPNPGGGTCSDISDSFEVVVNAIPDSPVVSFTVMDCDDYTMKLEAIAPGPGDLNWSNGMEGSPVYVHSGGPYQVLYTDANGCTSKERIQTPRDLRAYLWSFPTGCYSLCYTNANELAGPIMYFDQWAYRHNGMPFHSGSFGGGNPFFSNVSLNGNGPGYYQMYLDNIYCNILSDTMDVDFDCRPGGPGALGTGMKPYSTAVRDQVSAPPMLQIAPNPAGGHTQLSYRYNAQNGPASIEVYDMLGRAVYGRQLQEASGSFDLGLEHFVPGNYRVVLRQGGGILVHGQLSVTH